MDTNSIRLAEHNRLMEAAKERAAQLRTEAIREWLADAGCGLREAGRIVRTLASRLTHRRQLSHSVKA